MGRQIADKLKWTAKRWASRLNWMWVSGLGILAFCAGFYLSVIGPARQDFAQLQSEAESLRAQAARGAVSSAEEASSPPQQLAAFYRYFPADKNMSDWMEKIYRAAETQNLTLAQGEYKMTRDKSGRLAEYQITLPVKGSYLQIRRFLDSVLSHVTAVSLDNVKFERQKVGEESLEATVKLTLYLEQAA